MALAMAAVMCCSYLPVGAFAETPPPQESTVVAEEQQTDENETDSGQTDASSPDPGSDTEEAPEPSEVQNEERPEEEPPAEDAESMIEPPAQEVAQEPAEENEPYTFDGEILYADMPDAPTGSYIGSYGLPVATGETKIGLGAWDADLEQTNYLSAEALDSDNIPIKTEDVSQFKEYAKQYGVLFAVIKDKSAQGEKVDIMFKAEDVSKLNRIYEQMGYNIPKAQGQTDRKKAPARNPQGPELRVPEKGSMTYDKRPSVRMKIDHYRAVAKAISETQKALQKGIKEAVTKEVR